ncbi:MAG: DUF4179 domain-containing protein [Lachnospiraceae bacterium]|nr:DUF4179 domain-containing protein [Lachnospiraceae bacterium]
MSTFREEYKMQMNELCDANCKITAEDILKYAKEKVSISENVIDLQEHKKKKRVWKAFVPAACFLLIGTTALAATGQLGEMFRKIFKDETTAELVEQGYLYEIHQTVEEDIFNIELIAVTGDTDNPKLLFDVYVNDEELVARNDKLRISAYNLGVDAYENELDQYVPCEAYGVKDKKIDNLYHVSMPGAPYWMSGEEPVVTDICQIDFDLDRKLWTTYELNMEYRFTPPQDAFCPVSYKDYENMKFSYGGIDYYLTRGEYGSYSARFLFEYDYIGSEFADGEIDYGNLTEELHNNWLAFISTVTVVVDDKIYTVNKDNLEYTWYDEKGEIYKKNHCIVHAHFPSFNYEEATSVLIQVGDVSYTLK